MSVTSWKKPGERARSSIAPPVAHTEPPRYTHPIHGRRRPFSRPKRLSIGSRRDKDCQEVTKSGCRIGPAARSPFVRHNPSQHGLPGHAPLHSSHPQVPLCCAATPVRSPPSYALKRPDSPDVLMRRIQDTGHSLFPEMRSSLSPSCPKASSATDSRCFPYSVAPVSGNPQRHRANRISRQPGVGKCRLRTKRVLQSITILR